MNLVEANLASSLDYQLLKTRTIQGTTHEFNVSFCIIELEACFFFFLI
jgi:hypothetical protein